MEQPAIFSYINGAAQEEIKIKRRHSATREANLTARRAYWLKTIGKYKAKGLSFDEYFHISKEKRQTALHQFEGRAVPYARKLPMLVTALKHWKLAEENEASVKEEAEVTPMTKEIDAKKLIEALIQGLEMLKGRL